MSQANVMSNIMQTVHADPKKEIAAATAAMQNLNANLSASSSKKQEPFHNNALGYITYKRTYARRLDDSDPNSPTEEWLDTNLRCINSLPTLGLILNEQEKQELLHLFMNHKCSLAGRFLFQLGTKTVQKMGLLSLQNCAATVVEDPIEPFVWAMTALMLGVGVGFNIQKQYVDKLPPVKHAVPVRLDTNDADFIVPDSREGWVRLLREVLTAHFVTGKDFTYSAVLIRSKGAPVKGFGGTASGPDVLCEGMTKISGVLNARAGQKMRPIDCLDVMNIIGSIVCAGNIRRSAQIALGDCDDLEFLRAKRWDLGNIPNWRVFSNNSVVCDDVNKLPAEFWEGYRGNGEPYGLINLKLSRSCGRLGETQYPDPDVIGYNPCAEQSLAKNETCCLAEVFLPHMDSQEELWKCTEYLYRVCKHSLTLRAPLEDTEEIVHRHMRMGISVSGYLQASKEKRSWLRANYERLRAYDEEYSKQHGFPRSIKLTTVKPSGTLSLLAGVTPGVHPGFAQYFIRRVRIASDSPLIQYCRKAGYPMEFERKFDKTVDYNVMVVDFPCQYPEGTVLASQVSAIDQLEYVKELQTNWSDNSVSVTVYYRMNELPAIKEWLAKNYTTSVKSVSFLLHSDHGFDQAPYEAIDQGKFQEMERKIKKENAQDVRISDDDVLTSFECAKGMCPIR